MNISLILLKIAKKVLWFQGPNDKVFIPNQHGIVSKCLTIFTIS